jgi:hypothetical protein
MSDVVAFVVTYKWWLAALVPFAIAYFVLKLRG